MWQYNYHTSDSLQHAKGFQYIAKVKVPGGGSRYFYSQQEYQAYLKSSTNKATNALKSLTKPNPNAGVNSLVKRASTAANKSPRELQIERLANKYAIGRKQAENAIAKNVVTPVINKGRSIDRRLNSAKNKMGRDISKAYDKYDKAVTNMANKYPERRQQVIKKISKNYVEPTLKKGREIDKKISDVATNYPEYRRQAERKLAEKVVKPAMKKGQEIGETAVDVVKNPKKYVNKAKEGIENAVNNYPENYDRAVNKVADKVVKPTIEKGRELEAKVSDLVNNYPEYRQQAEKWLADNAATPVINWSKDKIARGEKMVDDWMKRRREKRNKEYTREVMRRGRTQGTTN